MHRRKYAQGPHGRVIVGVESAGDRKSKPTENDRKAGPSSGDSKSTTTRKKPSGSEG